MLDNNQIISCAAEINSCIEDWMKLCDQHTKSSILKTVELLNHINENICKLAFLENSSMQYSVKIKLDNKEYSYSYWLNEMLIPSYSKILSYLEIDCIVNGVELDFDEQTMRVSLR